MKPILILALIFGCSTSLHAEGAHHAMRSPTGMDRSFGRLTDEWANPPAGRETCNGGPCTLSGGPSGGPNQS